MNHLENNPVPIGAYLCAGAGEVIVECYHSDAIEVALIIGFILGVLIWDAISRRL